MVRLFSNENAEKISDFLYLIFHMQERYTHIVEVNRPDITPGLFAMWHCNQMCTYGIVPIQNLNVLVSRSKDGEIIARIIEKMGYKTIRGSKGKKGAVEATMQMITALKSGENCAMMVDGPSGPPKIAKIGVVKVAKMSGIPIIPVSWYSNNITLLKFPSWDGLRMPFYHTNLVNLYGEPIYVPHDANEEEILKQLQASLEDLDKRVREVYKEVYQFGLWKKKRLDSSQYRWNP